MPASLFQLASIAARSIVSTPPISADIGALPGGCGFADGSRKAIRLVMTGRASVVHGNAVIEIGVYQYRMVAVAAQVWAFSLALSRRFTASGDGAQEFEGELNGIAEACSGGRLYRHRRRHRDPSLVGELLQPCVRRSGQQSSARASNGMSALHERSLRA